MRSIVKRKIFLYILSGFSFIFLTNSANAGSKNIKFKINCGQAGLHLINSDKPNKQCDTKPDVLELEMTALRVGMRLGYLALAGEVIASVGAGGQLIFTGELPEWYKAHWRFIANLVKKEDDSKSKQARNDLIAESVANSIAAAATVLGKFGGVAGDIISGGSPANAAEDIARPYKTEAGLVDFYLLSPYSQKIYLDSDPELVKLVKQDLTRKASNKAQ